MKIFISWSGSKSCEYARVIENTLYKVVKGSGVEIFFSPEIDRGKNWLSKISNALNESYFGFIIVTKDNIFRPWINFESGAISKASEESNVIPILVDIKREDLSRAAHPLQFFQSIYFEWDEINKVINQIGKIKNCHIDDRDKKDAENTFVEGLRFLNDKYKQNEDSIKGQIITKFDIQEGESYSESGIISAISDDRFFKIRRFLVENCGEKLILMGSSLTNAFSNSEHRNGILDTLKKDLSNINGRIKEVEVYLTDPFLFDEECDNSITNPDSPFKRISDSVTNFINVILPSISEGKKISFYFIPLIQMDHLVFANNIMLIRNTMLWDSGSAFKASWLLCEQTEKDTSMYNSYLRYVDEIKKNCIPIPIQNYDDTDCSITKARKFHYELRNSLNYKDKRKTVTLHKLYRTQLISSLHSTWNSKYGCFSVQRHWEDPQNAFKSSNYISTRNDLFNPNNLLGDRTQEILLPYIKKTEEIFREVVQKYDKSGDVQIFPSLDLGVPNNIQRLAGGFATGMLIVWKCGTPIVPVDTTVNVCSSSLIELSEDISKDFTSSNIKNIMEKGTNEGYSCSFKNGNHFAMICKSEYEGKNKFYLVLHSSAEEFKSSYLGLYPNERNWFTNKIKTEYSKDKRRYLRYLKDEDAIHFIKTAKALNEHNKDIHRWFAEEFCKNLCRINDVSSHNHYYMPTDYSIAIGTFVEDPGVVVPIFSNKGYPIYKFESSRYDGFRIELAGKEKCLIPHGWGQEFISNNVNDLYAMGDSFLIGEKSYNIDSKNRLITDKDIRIRKFSQDEYGMDFFELGQRFLRGKVKEVLKPIACFSRETEQCPNGVLLYQK